MSEIEAKISLQSFPDEFIIHPKGDHVKGRYSLPIKCKRIKDAKGNIFELSILLDDNHRPLLSGGYQPRGKPIDITKLKPPKGGSTIQPPKAPEPSAIPQTPPLGIIAGDPAKEAGPQSIQSPRDDPRKEVKPQSLGWSKEGIPYESLDLNFYQWMAIGGLIVTIALLQYALLFRWN